jgi:succinate dehydrogenase flavin-adding protein (antitoxin of CptAB toxin-antitoxin module)
MLPIYQRVRDEGRMFPEGLKYIDSLIEPNFSRYFQLMECNDLRLLQEWIFKQY